MDSLRNLPPHPLPFNLPGPIAALDYACQYRHYVRHASFHYISFLILFSMGAALVGVIAAAMWVTSWFNVTWVSNVIALEKPLRG